MTELSPELQAVADELDREFTKDELLALADNFGVEVKHNMRKEAIARAYAEDGVSVEIIRGLHTPTEEELRAEGLHPLAEGELEQTAPAAEVDDEEDLILVRMTRGNGTYEIRGYRFTRLHPFALVKESDADYLIEVDGGFRVASPREAREYYG